MRRRSCWRRSKAHADASAIRPGVGVASVGPHDGVQLGRAGTEASGPQSAADHHRYASRRSVGAYGHARARTPDLDALARAGVRFDRAYAAAPITLPSHATLADRPLPAGTRLARQRHARLAGRADARHRASRRTASKTAAFVAAFPLDHQFGLNRGFDVYSDRSLGRRDGTARERAARIAGRRRSNRVAAPNRRRVAVPPARSNPPASPPAPPAPPAFFLWVHLFEPHAPYGDRVERPAGARSVRRRDRDRRSRGRAAARRRSAPRRQTRSSSPPAITAKRSASTASTRTASSSTTRRCACRSSSTVPASAPARVSPDAVTLADVAPTAAAAARRDACPKSTASISRPPSAARALPQRELYAESFAPLVEFGWAPLRAIRSGPWKLIAAPKPELFDIDQDPGEQTNLAAANEPVVRELEARASRYSGADAAERRVNRRGSRRAPARARLQRRLESAIRNPQRREPDPKDRRELAARIAQVTRGELTGAALVAALEAIVRDDPRNGQAHLRLGYARLQAGDCARAEPEFHAAASCGAAVRGRLSRARDLPRPAARSGRRRAGAGRGAASRAGQPVGHRQPRILQAAKGNLPGAIQALNAALATDPSSARGALQPRARLREGRPATRGGSRRRASCSTGSLKGRPSGPRSSACSAPSSRPFHNPSIRIRRSAFPRFPAIAQPGSYH